MRDKSEITKRHRRDCRTMRLRPEDSLNPWIIVNSNLNTSRDKDDLPPVFFGSDLIQPTWRRFSLERHSSRFERNR